MKNIVLDVKSDPYRYYEKKHKRNNQYSIANNSIIISDFIRNSIVDATAIMKRNFPQINSDIFISYSHLDYNYVKNIAYEIEEKYELSCFIDSDVWNYYEDIIDNIMVEYKEIDDHEINKIRDNVDIMLATSLMNIMNNSKLILLFDTGNYKKYQEGEEFTYSPWIFHELCCAKIIDINNQKDKPIIKHMNESVSFKYSLDDYSFDSIIASNFLNWLDEIKRNNYRLLSDKSIDLLYNKYENINFINRR